MDNFFDQYEVPETPKRPNYLGWLILAFNWFGLLASIYIFYLSWAKMGIILTCIYLIYLLILVTVNFKNYKL